MTSPLIRTPKEADLPALTALCLRSKAHWGYDAAFMAACREELTLTPKDLDASAVAMIEQDGQPVGIAQVGPEGPDADLDKLFVDPAAMGAGLGRQLFNWCVSAAQEMGASRLLIEADPQAEAFYRHMGAERVGLAPSGSIAGRHLPLMVYHLERG